MADIDLWVRHSGRQLLFVYGENDPWGAEPFHLGRGTRDSLTLHRGGRQPRREHRPADPGRGGDRDRPPCSAGPAWARRRCARPPDRPRPTTRCWTRGTRCWTGGTTGDPGAGRRADPGGQRRGGPGLSRVRDHHPLPGSRAAARRGGRAGLVRGEHPVPRRARPEDPGHLLLPLADVQGGTSSTPARSTAGSSTEFLGPVGYGAPYGGIDAAAGHQINEGRWLRDQQYVKDYLGLLAARSGLGAPSPRTEFLDTDTTDWAHQYSFWAADAVWPGPRSTGDRAFTADRLPELDAAVRKLGRRTSTRRSGCTGRRRCGTRWSTPRARTRATTRTTAVTATGRR